MIDVSRSDFARTALFEHMARTNHTPTNEITDDDIVEADVADLLADLMHLCREVEINFAECHGRATDSFLQEARKDNNDEKVSSPSN